MTHTGYTAGCDCRAYPAEVERDCCCIGGTECLNAEAPSPLAIEDGADSAIAIHSGGDSSGTVASNPIPAADADGRTESRRTVQGSPVEADEAVSRGYPTPALTAARLLEALRSIAAKEPAPSIPGCTCDRYDLSDDNGDFVMCDLHEKSLRHLRWETLASLVIDYQAFLRHALAAADAALATPPAPAAEVER